MDRTPPSIASDAVSDGSVTPSASALLTPTDVPSPGFDQHQEVAQRDSYAKGKTLVVYGSTRTFSNAPASAVLFLDDEGRVAAQRIGVEKERAPMAGDPAEGQEAGFRRAGRRGDRDDTEAGDKGPNDAPADLSAIHEQILDNVSRSGSGDQQKRTNDQSPVSDSEPRKRKRQRHRTKPSDAPWHRDNPMSQRRIKPQVVRKERKPLPEGFRTLADMNAAWGIAKEAGRVDKQSGHPSKMLFDTASRVTPRSPASADGQASSPTEPTRFTGCLDPETDTRQEALTGDAIEFALTAARSTTSDTAVAVAESSTQPLAPSRAIYDPAVHEIQGPLPRLSLAGYAMAYMPATDVLSTHHPALPAISGSCVKVYNSGHIITGETLYRTTPNVKVLNTTLLKTYCSECLRGPHHFVEELGCSLESAEARYVDCGRCEVVRYCSVVSHVRHPSTTRGGIV